MRAIAVTAGILFSLGSSVKAEPPPIHSPDLQPAAAKKKLKKTKKPVAPGVDEAAVKKALDGSEGQVGDCVSASAPAGDWSREVEAKVTLNSLGQVMGVEVTVLPKDETAETVRACVERVARAIVFPKVDAPLMTVTRQWKLSTQQ